MLIITYLGNISQSYIQSQMNRQIDVFLKLKSSFTLTFGVRSTINEKVISTFLALMGNSKVFIQNS